MKQKKKKDSKLSLVSEEPSPKKTSVREADLEKLVSRLEQRIEGLEGELAGVRDELSDEKGKASQGKREEEVQFVAGLIEEKIRKLAAEFAPEKRGRTSQILFIYQQLKKLANLTSLDAFKQILLALWYRGPKTIPDVDEFGMDAEFAEKAKPLFDFLYYSYWRVGVQGVHHIPEEGRALIVGNHSGTLPYDGAMIRLAGMNDHPSRRDIRFLVEDFVYHFPFLGTFMYRTGGVRACQENATRLLETDHVVAVFPEGIKGIGKHYKHRYHLQRFGRGGFIKLALRTQTPIIPAAVIGAEEIHPLFYKSKFMAKPLGVPYIPITATFPWLGVLGIVPLPSKWTIIFGEPMQWKQYKPEHAEDPLLVNRLSEEVRTRIQEMLIQGLSKRRSIWFG